MGGQNSEEERKGWGCEKDSVVVIRVLPIGCDPSRLTAIF
jgi:hypothetical protein